MAKRALSPEIVRLLEKKTKKKESTIRKDISLLRRSHGSLPINTVAQIYAIQNRTSVLTKLTTEEKEKLPHLTIDKPIRITQKKSKELKSRKTIIPFIKYESNKKYINDHILETNKTYTNGCYTACFMLARKIIENLLTDIIKQKYPGKGKRSVELYFDIPRGRIRDFSEILAVLGKNSKDFGPDKKLVERIVSKSNPFKDDANDKTHSWYHIVKNKKELDEQNIPDILEMISDLQANIVGP